MTRLVVLFAAQYTNGGLPQRYPNPTDFHAHITFNDSVMMGDPLQKFEKISAYKGR